RRLFAGDVGGETDGLEALRGKRLGHGFCRRAVDVRSDDAGPRLGEFLRIDLADPFAAAGDDDGAAGQVKARVHGAASMDQARIPPRMATSHRDSRLKPTG